MVGRTISHYRIVGQLGSGGMGVVYGAEDLRLGRQVALKFVSDDLAHDEQAVLRLRTEARAASALNHPNICTIYDIGEEDGHPFIVMELLRGQTLRERLNSGPLRVHQLVDIGIEIADALQAAHQQGIVHRDIKPGNIFITERGHVKVLDFGLAKLASGLGALGNAMTTAHTTSAGITYGTAAYMSPEQATGEQLDGRSDLFSLGVVLYEAATGHHPFPGKTSAVVLAGILERAPVPALARNPDLPARLSEIISNCLEKDRELRYQSAADLRADLRRVRRDLDSSQMRSASLPVLDTEEGLTPGSGGRTAGGASSGVRQADAPAGTGAGRGKTMLAVAGGVVLIALAGVAFWMREAPPPDETTTPGTTTAQTSPSAPEPARVSTERQMTLAAASLQAGNFRAALAYAREVLAIDPSHADAAKVRDQAEAMLERFDNAVADARRRLSSGDLQGATRALEEARGLDASSPTVAELGARLSEAIRQRGASAAARRPAPPEPSRERAAVEPPEPAPPTVSSGAPAQAPSTQPPQPDRPPGIDAPQPPATEPQQTQATPPPDQPPQSPQASPPAREVPPPQRADTVLPPAPAAPSGAPKGRPPSPPAAANDEAAIRQVLATYARAIEQKDLALFRSIKPNLTREEERRLEEGFRAVSSQNVSLSVVSIEPQGDRAVVVVNRRDVIRAGGREQTSQTQQTLTLARTPGGWIISEIR